MLTHVKSGIPVVAISVIAAFWMAPVLAVAAPPDWGKAGQGQDTGEGAPPPQPSTPTYERPTRPAPGQQRPQAPRGGPGSPQAPGGSTTAPGTMSRIWDESKCPLPSKTATTYSAEHVQKPTDYVLRDADERLVTSIRVQKGATVCIRADGTINFGGGLAGLGDVKFDPDGENAPAPNDFRAPGLRKYSLACGIQPFQASAVSRWYQCGKAQTFTADQEGWLVLLQNDNVVRDNRGQWTVRSLVVTQPYWTGWAPAQTPILDAVLVIPSAGARGFTTVSPGANGWYEVLPIGTPSGGVRLQLHTPFPASLKVDVDGTDLVKDQSPGYSSTVTNDVSTTGVARWAVNVVPPPGKNTGSQYEIGVKISVGNQTSDRLVIKLVQKQQAPSPAASACSGPAETFATGSFSEVYKTNPFGYSNKTTGGFIEIWKGTTKIYSQARRGQGTVDVFYNQKFPVAMILERGVPLADANAHQDVHLVKLGPGNPATEIATATAQEIGRIMQSPDGKVIAIHTRDNLNVRPAEAVEFYKASPSCEGRKLGTPIDISPSQCNLINLMVTLRMDPNNTASLQCATDRSKPRSSTKLQ